MLKEKHDRVRVDGSRLLSRMEEFQESSQLQACLTKSTFFSKEFHRPEIIAAKFEALLALHRKEESLVVTAIHATDDMRAIEKAARRIHYKKQMGNLLGYHWFNVCITKLQDGAVRKRQPVLMSCLRFTGVLKCLFMSGQALTPKLFYLIMEKTVSERDHIHLPVYKMLKYAMDAVDISVESFLSYLESRDIQPCAEHLAHVRKLRAAGSPMGNNLGGGMLGSSNATDGSKRGSTVHFDHIGGETEGRRRHSMALASFDDDEMVYDVEDEIGSPKE